MHAAANDNAPDPRQAAPLRYDPAHWFAWVMVAASVALGLWRAGAFS